jgi:hypothetical protein
MGWKIPAVAEGNEQGRRPHARSYGRRADGGWARKLLGASPPRIALKVPRGAPWLACKARTSIGRRVALARHARNARDDLRPGPSNMSATGSFYWRTS